MREIKFNAWIKAHEITVTVDSIDFAEEEIMIIDDTGIDRYFPFEEIELLQYTGLRDKNGKEIYEGDVVSTEDGCFEGTTCGIVTEYKGMFTSFYGQDALGREQYDELHTVSGEREVIGNIYENPELLEGATNGSS